MDQAVTQSQFEEMRKAMVSSQLRTNAVNDPAVVSVMRRIPREAFLPESIRSVAYRDRPLPLGNGRLQNQPLVTARLITELELNPDDTILVVGATGGYSAAIAAELAGTVVALEEDADLLAIARGATGDANGVRIVEGPLNEGVADGAPYDAILIDGAVETVPQALIDQLKIGGRLATGLVDRGITRLAIGRKTEHGFGLFDFADIDCVELPGFAKPKTFSF